VAEKRLIDVTVRFGGQESHVRVPEGTPISGVLNGPGRDNLTAVILNGARADLHTPIAGDEAGRAEVGAAAKSHVGG